MDQITAFIDATFSGPLAAVFAPINSLLAAIDNLYLGKACAAALFLLPMLWVYFILRREYVNLDAPGKQWYYDLRLWTILSMMPHVFFYLIF
ncbi:MAG: hypothetical protein GC168_05620 [Candidatus Hydrogenedens sp.]|nr:hypothetical protein [Candidatus Hydrogenedens sp.]